MVKWKAILLASFLVAFSAVAAERPNFLVIPADDLGYADLACFGNPDVKTPNLDRFASEGPVRPEWEHLRCEGKRIEWPDYKALRKPPGVK